MKTRALVAFASLLSLSAFASPTPPHQVVYACTYTHDYVEGEESSNEAKRVPFAAEDGTKHLYKDKSIGMWGKQALGGMSSKLYVWGTEGKISISAVVMSAASLPGGQTSAIWGTPMLSLEFPVDLKAEKLEDGTTYVASVKIDRIDCKRVP